MPSIPWGRCATSCSQAYQRRRPSSLGSAMLSPNKSKACGGRSIAATPQCSTTGCRSWRWPCKIYWCRRAVRTTAFLRPCSGRSMRWQPVWYAAVRTSRAVSVLYWWEGQGGCLMSSHDGERVIVDEISPAEVQLTGVGGGDGWKGLALVAGLESFENGWQKGVPHAAKDAGLVAETLNSFGFTSVVDLTNNTLHTHDKVQSHKCGDLSYWEIQHHFENACKVAGDGVLFFYLSTRATWSPQANRKSTPDSLCAYNDGSTIKLAEFITTLGKLTTGANHTVMLLDLSVAKQVDSSSMPNLSELCPPKFSVMLSFTPIEAPVFTLKFLQAMSGLRKTPGDLGVTLKGVAWSNEINSDLNIIAGRCHEAERVLGVAPEDRKWLTPDWIPTTAAADINDPAMDVPLLNPSYVGYDAPRNLNIMATLTKEVSLIEDNLNPMFSKLKALEAITGEDQGSIVAMQPLQCVIVTQSSSTPLKAWEEFRTRYTLNSTELQKIDKKDPQAGSNYMVVYIKFGFGYQPGSEWEREFSELEKVYVGVKRLNKDFYFGTDPRAGLTKEQNAESTEFACKVKSLSLRLEATYKTSLASHIRLLCEARTPPHATSVLSSVDSTYKMEVFRLKNLLSPDQTGVRYRADVEYQKKQMSRSKAARKMNTGRAIGADAYGTSQPTQEGNLLATWLQVPQEVHIECAIRIQSVVRMFFVRKAYNCILKQIGVIPRSGPEMRMDVRKWLLACSQHFTWTPLSSTVLCYCSSGVQVYTHYGGPSYADINVWCQSLTRIRTTIVSAVARALMIPENRVRLQGVNGILGGPRFVVKLSIVSTWSGGGCVPSSVRSELFEDARRLALVLQTQLKQEFDVSKVILPHPRPVHGLEHLDIRLVTPESAIKAVLTSKSNGAGGIPSDVRKALENALRGDTELAKETILKILLDDSGITGWRRRVLEVPMMPGSAMCRLTDASVARMLQLDREAKERCRMFVVNKTAYETFTVARLRGEKAPVYEIPGVRQLEKTPLILHSRYWADEGYYDDLPDYVEMQEKERVKLMMPTVRHRRELKERYNVKLFTDLWYLAAEEMGKFKVRLAWFVSLVFLCLSAYSIFLLPKWVSNLTALIYNSDNSQLSLEQLMTWVMFYVLLLMLCLGLYGITITVARNKFSFRVFPPPIVFRKSTHSSAQCWCTSSLSTPN
eukprot:TRINITY_DN6655_c0_g1_i3.p1 TRINITY_DN6655_c0_g1~~TRINITY_DN6655_c0_g1_i3.p1  ORF type:complete len:1180 (+),score=314.32 TRINITY_DN6655_c0_g1_i3:1382-4921(+)